MDNKEPIVIDLDSLEEKKKNYWYHLIGTTFWLMVILQEVCHLQDNDKLWWLSIVVFEILWICMVIFTIYTYKVGRAYWYFTVSYYETVGLPLKIRRKFLMHKLVRNVLGLVLYTPYTIIALVKRLPFTYTICACFILAFLIYGSGLGLNKLLVDPDEDDSIVDDNFRY